MGSPRVTRCQRDLAGVRVQVGVSVQPLGKVRPATAFARFWHAIFGHTKAGGSLRSFRIGLVAFANGGAGRAAVVVVIVGVTF